MLHAGEQLWKGIVVRTFGGAEDDLVGVVQAEGDGVAILEFTTFDSFAIDEEAAALAAIFEIETISFDHHRGAIAGNAAVGELQVVAGFDAAADHKRRLGDAGVAARAVGGDDFEHCFTG